ncbi:MAG: D-alanine--D-alanine ligase [Clostridia bacterium]|jgi:D-alanine-D-alanine ligase|nr:D-alanine--D-alanine ligase [Clostridia bacterium]MDD3231746.1 D-alanine--D-alanine ligase [Clostridia bacterium]MDD3862407.1 D-alanine--D-alanine ligase [Clostridia bacterium]MDD4408226.1 D-alanine--D-alanine ligase [Clostridia bacterium]
MENIAVFFGGVSSEHDISIITGIQTINSLDKKKYKVFPIYISKSGKWFYSEKFERVDKFFNFKEKSHKNVFLMCGDNFLYQKIGIIVKKIAEINSAIICCHGLNGEDGTLQGLLELSNVPYSSSGVLGSSVCMDKIIMKQLFEVNNFPVTDYVWFNNTDFDNKKEMVITNIKKNLQYPLIVKPANLGSSIGISKCNNDTELTKAIEIAKCYDLRIIVEEAVENLREINCACIGNQDFAEVSKLEEPIPWESFLSFKQKYLNIANVKYERKDNINLSKDIKSKIKKLTKDAFFKLCCSGIVRVDFLVDDKSDDVFINEINTIPGSLANYLWKNLNYTTLLDKLIEISKQNFENKKKCCFSYDSDALKNFKNNNNSFKINK